MQITRNRHRWGLATRRPFAALLLLALAGVGSIANAIEFDEKLKAPAMKNVSELHTQAQSFAARFGEIRAATPAQLITNSTLARQQFDFKWQVQQAIDQRKPIEELADLGFVEQPDGSFNIDLSAHPEWDDLPLTLVAALTGPTFEQWAPALIQRGFRPEDIKTLSNYVATHDVNKLAVSAGLPLALGFGRTVRKYDKLKIPVPDSLVVSYMYQRQRLASETNRTWTDGALKALDAQRGRILLSLSLEMKSQATWVPEDPAAAIAEKLAQVRQPDFENQLSAEAKGVAP